MTKMIVQVSRIALYDISIYLVKTKLQVWCWNGITPICIYIDNPEI